MVRKRFFLLLICFFFNGNANKPTMIKAQTAYEKGDYKNAINHYKLAIKKGESIVPAYFNIANAFYQIDSLCQAVVYYKSALNSAPEFFPAQQNLAITYYTLNDIGKAIAATRKCLRLRANDEKSLMILGACYKAAGELALAAIQFERVYSCNHNRYDVVIALAEIYRDLNDNKTALDWLDLYPDTEQQYSYVLNLKADICEKQNDIEKACYYLNSLCKYEPQNQWILFRLAQLYKKDGRMYLALEVLEKGVLLFPECKEISLLAGNCAFEIGCFSKAEHYYSIASKLGAPGGFTGLSNIRNTYTN